MKINLTGIPETLFITLRIRAIETTRPDGLLRDEDAVRILKQINFEASEKDVVSQVSQIGTIARTLLLDQIITEFVAQNPNGIIINLGCGLDARHKRLNYNGCHWFDIDVEETIKVKRIFFEETSNYTMITSSIFEKEWILRIPQDKKILFISEGVMMYFKENEIKHLFSLIIKNFLQAEIAIDTISHWAVRYHKRHPDVKKYNAPFKWGVYSPNEIELWNNQIHLIEAYPLIQQFKKRWPLSMRILNTIYPPMMKGFQVLHFRLYKKH